MQSADTDQLANTKGQDECLATLLLVEEESSALDLLATALQGDGYRLLKASGGEAALALMERESVDLVITGARVPDMDRVELLSAIQQKWPDCIRVMLTDQADPNAMVHAINKGRVHSVITQPWNDEELHLMLRQALAHQHAEREQKRLEAATQQQNRTLAELNSTLEQRVEARTQELKQLSDMLDAAYVELERSHVTATRALASLLNLRLSSPLQTNAQVDALVRTFAEIHDLDETLRRDLLMAAALYNMGRLIWSDRLLNTPEQKLFAQDQVAYQRYPVTGEKLLTSLEHLQGTARIIRHHRERWNGTGFPDQLEGNAIPYGARLLGLAVDFTELQRGMILPRKVPRQQVLSLLRKFSGRIYDPDLCNAFVKMCLEQAPDLGVVGQSVESLVSSKLKPGMILAQDLYSESGILLLHEGKELTRGLIEKLIHFEEVEDIRYSLLIRKPESQRSGPGSESHRLENKTLPPQ
ncbi:HD domain-containing phosphohydrolase [Billgrantia endophytica]|uniref:Two-component system response regulator n=1 Tax=Billgrantia endophytica TaxID=2033802 RepID=A0A2N7TWF8_9GAMM|nr:HD domain-containing phosphohydrolase [Halomonas endophytica]PMR72520.1 two-component system response regulator [Halomonas endophytica]